MKITEVRFTYTGGGGGEWDERVVLKLNYLEAKIRKRPLFIIRKSKFLITSDETCSKIQIIEATCKGRMTDDVSQSFSLITEQFANSFE